MLQREAITGIVSFQSPSRDGPDRTFAVHLSQNRSNKLHFFAGPCSVRRGLDGSRRRLLLGKFIAIEFVRQRPNGGRAGCGTLRNAWRSLYRFSTGYSRSFIRDTNQITLRATQRIKSPSRFVICRSAGSDTIR